MDEHVTKMTPLDQMVCQDHLQMLKAAIPYLPQSNQKFLSIYAKIMELSHTISYFQQPLPEIAKMDSSLSMQPMDMLQELRNYMSDATKNRIDQLLFAFNTIQLMQMYQEIPTPMEEENESESLDE